jgi:hypothetical protein
MHCFPWFCTVDVCLARCLDGFSVAKNWIRTVAANYTAFDFFFNRYRCVVGWNLGVVLFTARFRDRSTIQSEFQTILNEKLDVLHANVDSLQLLDAELPASFNEARTAQAAAFQDISVAASQATVARDRAAANAAVALQAAQV